jgi:hypothetical protein
MKISISKILIWPRNKTKKKRIISFKEGCINVITGDSKTGKSSITWIVDYCLGSGKCSIPVGLIRDLSEWFGVLLKLSHTEMIIARKNPGGKQSTNEIYWSEGLKVDIPDYPEKNGRVEDIVNRFNQISMLPSLDFKSAGYTSGFANRPSFRDMAAFNFQPQHIMANPFTLYYKADTTEHREKLKIIFPLVLGATDAGILSKQRELIELEADARRIQSQITSASNANKAWEGEIQSYYIQAREYGLLPESPDPKQYWPPERYIKELFKVSDVIASLEYPSVSADLITQSANEIADLIRQEDWLTIEIGSRRRRLSKISALSTSITGYQEDLIKQEDKLDGVGWLEKQFEPESACPLCNSSNSEAQNELAGLKTLLTQYKELTESLVHAPIKLDKEEAEIKAELKEYAEKIDLVRKKRKELEDKNEELSALRQQSRQVYLFAGRIQQALKNYQVDSILDELKDKYSKLLDRINLLKESLDPQKRRTQIKRVISIVSRKVSDYSKLLNLEHWEDNVSIDIRELTLRFTSELGRKDYLWEIGSGANWMGYHVAVFLSLHEYFLTLRNNPVPTFLILDQPSQVYYPERWPKDELQQEINIPEDIEGVRRIFRACDLAIQNTTGDLQIIITEHAGPITWENVQNINYIGNWREGKDDYLIPKDWIE